MSEDNHGRLHDDEGLFMPGQQASVHIGDGEEVEPAGGEDEEYDEDSTEEQKDAYRRILGFAPSDKK